VNNRAKFSNWCTKKNRVRLSLALHIGDEHNRSGTMSGKDASTTTKKRKADAKEKDDDDDGLKQHKTKRPRGDDKEKSSKKPAKKKDSADDDVSAKKPRGAGKVAVLQEFLARLEKRGVDKSAMAQARLVAAAMTGREDFVTK
jgi:hypothetical protein